MIIKKEILGIRKWMRNTMIWGSVQGDTGRADRAQGAAGLHPCGEQRTRRSGSAYQGCRGDAGKRRAPHRGMGRECHPAAGGAGEGAVQERDQRDAQERH